MYKEFLSLYSHKQYLFLHNLRNTVIKLLNLSHLICETQSLNIFNCISFTMTKVDISISLWVTCISFNLNCQSLICTPFLLILNWFVFLLSICKIFKVESRDLLLLLLFYWFFILGGTFFNEVLPSAPKVKFISLIYLFRC